MGCSEEHAALAADVLLQADLRGIDSHGVARLVGYVRLWEKNRINSKPNITIVHETPTTATVDGNAGLGLVVAPFAMKLAIQKAEQYGSGWVSVRNSNHFGIAGYHALMAVENDRLCYDECQPPGGAYFFERAFVGNQPHVLCLPGRKISAGGGGYGYISRR